MSHKHQTPVHLTNCVVDVGPKPTTLPFGVVALAKPTEAARVRNLEQLCEIVCLRPVSTSGGRMLGLTAGDSRVGLSHEVSLCLAMGRFEVSSCHLGRNLRLFAVERMRTKFVLNTMPLKVWRVV